MLCNEIYDALFKEHLFLREIFIFHSRISSFPAYLLAPVFYPLGVVEVKIIIFFVEGCLKCHNLPTQRDFTHFVFHFRGFAYCSLKAGKKAAAVGN